MSPITFYLSKYVLFSVSFRIKILYLFLYRDRAYLPNSDYSSSLSSSQSDYPGTSNSQPAEFSGKTDYEGSLNDYTGSGTQQALTNTAYTIGSSYRGSSLENYPASQEATNVRGFVQASNQAGFVASPSYPDTTSNRGVYTGSGFKALDVSGYRGYHPSSGTREFIGSGKHRGQVTSVSSKYPIYESSSSSGNEVEYTPSYSSSSPQHVYSAGNYKRESYNSGGGAPQGGYSPGLFNFLPSGSIKGPYSTTGSKGHSSAFSGMIIIFNSLFCFCDNSPGESFELKFISNQSEIFRIIPKSASEPNSFIPI